MANILPREKQFSVLHLLLEGSSIRSVERLTGIARNTIMRIMVRFGEGCEQFLDHTLRNLKLRHVQIDEIWTFVHTKQGHLTDRQKNDEEIGDQYLWLAFDTDTKLIASHILGKRTGGNAYCLLANLRERCDIVSQISTDGLACYPEAVRNTFGNDTCHGVVIKVYANPESGRYAPPDLIRTERFDIQGITDLKTICTSHVERCNLTIRTFMKRFTRLALGFSKKRQNLAAAVAMHVVYYNFARIHGTLRCTPAMSAHVTERLWSLPELFDEVERIVWQRKRKARINRMQERMRSIT